MPGMILGIRLYSYDATDGAELYEDIDSIYPGTAER